MVRLAVLAYAGGNAGDAAALAQSLILIDDVDRDMEHQDRGAGGLVLAHVFKANGFFLPLECFKCEPPSVYVLLLMGVASYNVYDWNQANRWLNRALTNTHLKSREARDAATMLLANAEKMVDHRDRALALAGQIKLPKGAKVNAPWYYARQLEWELLHMQQKPDYPGAMAAMQQVLDRAPSYNEFAQQALLLQAQLLMNFDLKQSKQLFERFAKMYPDLYPEAVKSQLAEIETKMTAKGSP